MIYVFDTNYYDDYDPKIQISDMIEECIWKYDNIREATIELMEDYFEARSDYGNPIEVLLKYVPDQNLGAILTDFHYLTDESKDNLIKRIQAGEDC